MSRPAVYESAAARQAAYRARKGRTVTVHLSEDTAAGLAAYLQRQHMDGDCDATLSSVIEKLCRQQLLRKR